MVPHFIFHLGNDRSGREEEEERRLRLGPGNIVPGSPQVPKLLEDREKENIVFEKRAYFTKEKGAPPFF